MKAYKVELLIVDHDSMSADDVRDTLENANYPNDCIYPRVMQIHCADIGEWDDSHPLNHSGRAPAEYARLFATEAQPLPLLE